MKIRITQLLAEGEIDLVKFKQVLGKTWDMEMAVKQSLRNVVSADGNEAISNKFREFVYLGMDWDGIIGAFNKTKDESVAIRMFGVEYEGWTKFVPKTIGESAREFELGEIKEDGKDVILIQSLIKQPSFTIWNMIKNGQFIYSKEDNFKPIIEV